MLEVRFIGESDENFTNGKVYKIIKFDDDTPYYGKIDVWFINNYNKIVYIPYSTLNTFNENWVVFE